MIRVNLAVDETGTQVGIERNLRSIRAALDGEDRKRRRERWSRRFYILCGLPMLAYCIVRIWLSGALEYVMDPDTDRTRED